MNKYIAALIVLLSLASPALAAGGSLSLVASSTAVSVGDTFTVRVRGGSGGVQVNTVGADLNYPVDLLAAASVSGPSVITLYVAKGVTDTGVVSIQGGILPPQTLSNSPIGTITFRAVAPGTAVIAVAASSGIYANDGKGTDILTGRGSLTINIGPKKPTPPPVTTNTNAPPVVQTPVNQPPVNVNIEPPLTNVQPPVEPQPLTAVEQQSCVQDWRFPAAVGASAAFIIIGLWLIGRGLHGCHRRRRKLFSK